MTDCGIVLYMYAAIWIMTKTAYVQKSKLEMSKYHNNSLCVRSTKVKF